MRSIILASSSPRRREIFARAGLPFEVEDSGIDESADLPAEPREVAVELALRKARAVAARHPDAIVIGADTVVALGSELFGKPETPERDRIMLGRLSGATHSIFTGFAIVDAARGKEISRVEETHVRFRHLSGAEIDAYVATGEGLDKAGGYALQGGGADFGERITGEQDNGMGLPLAAVLEELKRIQTE